MNKFRVMLLCVCLNIAYGEGERSLTFVIDDTGSMGPDIAQVKVGVNLVFDAVLNSNASRVENFILVTFNDPDVQVRTITKDRDEFKRSVASIRVHGGDDCPEAAMRGIQEGLERSLPGSYLYVFTDAAAKDDRLLPKVQNLAVKLKSQVVFLLTGKCGYFDDPAYHQLAKATSGQVFHMDKSNVGMILNYVAETVKNEGTIITSRHFPPGNGHNVSIPIDDAIKSILISQSGENPKLVVSNPDGGKPDVKQVVSLPSIIAVKVNTTKTGNYSAVFGSTSNTTLVVTGATELNFKHGFSGVEPTTIIDTASLPISGEYTYLAIELISSEENYHVNTVEIIDPTDEKVLEVLPVRLINAKQKLYVTEKLEAPKFPFKIAIKGENTESHHPFKRICSSVIEPQMLEHDNIKNKLIQMTIDKGLKVEAEYSKPLKLSCKVNGYPKPDIVWIHENGTTLSSAVATIEHPYVYMNVLSLDSVKTNSSYSCKAKNGISEVTEITYVNTKIPYYFNIIETPKDTDIQYKGAANISCIVDAEPPAQITWYGNGKEVTNGEFIKISSDKSLLSINDMREHLAGKYMCEARNDRNRNIFKFRISIYGFEKPKINETDHEIHTENGRDQIISCKILEGIPAPKLIWYFKRNGTESFMEIDQIDEVIYLENISWKNSGEYKCKATNDAGTDVHITSLEVGYAPTIEPEPKIVTSTEVERKGLHCVSYGTPRPKVIWYHNGKKIFNDRIYHISSHQMSLKFVCSKEMSGNYTCVASNVYGTTNQTVQIDYVVPVTVVAPKDTHLKKKVGYSSNLSCSASGYPEPTIKWFFYPSGVGESDKKPKEMSPNADYGSLNLKHLQLNQDGYYLCKADNLYSSANLTYHVEVFAPPYIEKNPKTTYESVLGDILRIPCNAFGNPKPSVTWVKDDYNIAAGTDWYDIDGNGALIIKDVDEKSAGTYSCYATNTFGNAWENSRVLLGPPDDNITSKTVYVEIGQDTELDCDVKHNIFDKVRWFKDGIVSPNSILRNVQLSDSGTYVCRISSLAKSTSAAVEIVVVYKPVFTRSDINYEIDYTEDQAVWLDCEANGMPSPQVLWIHNTKQMQSTEMFNQFDMNPNAIGSYTCIVGNHLGNITRSFEIVPQDCFLNILDDFNIDQPVMMNNNKLATFDTSKGYIQILKTITVDLYCPNGFTNFPKNIVSATCKKDKIFNIESNAYSYPELKCVEEVKPLIKWTGKRCRRYNSEIVQVGFDLNGEFSASYEVCWDKEKNVPSYAKHRIHSNIADTEPKEPKWYDDDTTNKFESLYDCDRQINTITRQLNKPFHESDKCCFNRRLLVSPRDLPSGISQKASYVHVNAAPQWSTCASENWAQVEQKVRNLAKNIDEDLVIWTGTSGSLELKTNRGGIKKIAIKDDSGTVTQEIPTYFWKVIQNPSTKSSVAIIQVNVPDVTIYDAYFHLMLCSDICNKIEWLRGVHWRDTTKGFTFCCSLDEFEKVFDFKGHFGENRGILSDYYWLPKQSLA